MKNSVRKMWADYCRFIGKYDTKDPVADHFCDNEKDANELADLVNRSIKQATACSLWTLEKTNRTLPVVGEAFVVTDWAGEAICVVKTTKVTIKPFSEILEEDAFREGEGDKSLAYWRKVHIAFYERELQPLGLSFDESMPVVFEEFERVFPYQRQNPQKISEIRLLDPGERDDIEIFYDHRERSAAESGKRDTPIFLVHPGTPYPRPCEELSQLWSASYDDKKWRRNWGAFIETNKIVGNVEVSGAGGASRHRVLFSLAIEYPYRRQGLGKNFLAIALDFAKQNSFEWLDAGVFSTNQPSLDFFRNNGFAEVGIVKDKYRIDGRSVDYHLFYRRV